MNLYPTGRATENASQHSTQPQKRSELKQQIKKLLESVAAQSNERRLCPQCGTEIKYIDTTFSLLGTSSTWNIKVPVCDCTVEKSAKNSNADRTN